MNSSSAWYARLSASGRSVASDDQTVRVLDTTSVRGDMPELARLPASQPTVAYLDDGALVTVSAGLEQVWDVAVGRRPHVLDAQVPLRDVAWTDAGLFTLDTHGRVRLWSPEAGVQLQDLSGWGAVEALALRSDGSASAAGLRSGEIRVADPSIQLAQTHLGPVTALAWSGAALWSGGRDGTVRSSTEQQVVELGVPVIAVATAGTRVAALGADGQIWVDGARFGPAASGLALSPDGRLLAVALEAGGVALLDFETAERRDLSADAAVTALGFAPNGRWLAIAGRDRAVRIRDLEDLSERARLLGHERPVRALCFGPDSSLATADEDGQVRLWDWQAVELDSAALVASVRTSYGLTRSGTQLRTVMP